MKLHQSVVEKLLYLYQTFGGYEYETKLKKAIAEMDLTPYDRKTTGDTVLVLTEQYIKEISGTKTRE